MSYRALRRRFRQAKHQLRDREDSTAGEPGSSPRSDDALRQEIESLQVEHQRTLHRIQREYDHEFNPDQPIPPITFQMVRELLPTDVPTAIVQYSITAERGLALVVTRDEVLALPLPDLDDDRSRELARPWFSAYTARPGPGSGPEHDRGRPSRAADAEGG